MNARPSQVPCRSAARRIAATLALATFVACLMLLAAWFKRSAPAESWTHDLGDVAILGLAILALFVPALALPRTH